MKESVASLEKAVEKQPAPVKEPVALLEKAVDRQPMTVKEAIASLNDEIDKPTPVKEPIAPPEKAIDPRNVEEIRKNAVQSWLRMRAREAESGLGKDAGSEESRQRSEGQRGVELRSAEQRPDVPRLQEQQSAGANARRNAERGPHDERGTGTDRAADRDHDQVGTGERDASSDRGRDHPQSVERDRNHERGRTGERGHGDRDGDATVSRKHGGYGDDFGM
jgi:hypothetical protein